VFAKLQHRPAPAIALSCSFFSVLAPHSQHPTFQPATDVITVFDYPLCPQTLTDLPTQRPQPKSFEINVFHTVFLATEGIPLAFYSGTHPVFLFNHLPEPILQPLSFQIHAGTGGCTPLADTSDRAGTLALSSLSATLMNLPASVANKRLNRKSKPFRCNTYKKTGVGPLLFAMFRSSTLRRLDVQT
jgi:hypothetical protein